MARLLPLMISVAIDPQQTYRRTALDAL